jgi:hypothetical protein
MKWNGALLGLNLLIGLAVALWLGFGVAAADSWDGGEPDMQQVRISCLKDSLGANCTWVSSPNDIVFRVLGNSYWQVDQVYFSTSGGEFDLTIKLYELVYSGGTWTRGTLLQDLSKHTLCTTTFIPWEGGLPPPAGNYQLEIHVVEDTMIQAACSGLDSIVVNGVPKRFTGAVAYWGRTTKVTSSDHDGLHDASWEVVETNQDFVPMTVAATPTATSTATNTPGPTSTPTNTPGPTNTPTPVPTQTPLPTYTPIPPFPTVAPGPTQQPQPTPQGYPDPIDYNGPLNELRYQLAQIAWEIGHLPERFAEGLHWALVPDGEYLQAGLAEIGAAWDAKVPAWGQLGTLRDEFGGLLTESECESYEGITLDLWQWQITLFGPTWLAWYCPWRPIFHVVTVISLGVLAVRTAYREVSGPQGGAG